MLFYVFDLKPVESVMKFGTEIAKLQDPMAFIAITIQDSNRANTMFELWGNEYQKWQPSPEQRVFLVSSNGSPNNSLPCLSLPSNYQKMRDSLFVGEYGPHFDRCIKRVYSVDYFVHNTTADFLALITDDVYVDLENLKEFINDMYSYGDPKTEPMVFGHCIDVEWVYLQGGSGYILSRRAAELMIRYGYEHMNALFEYDDIYFTRWFMKLGISMYETSSDRVIGHDFLGSNVHQIISHDWGRFPTCPETLDSVYCKVGPFRINRLAIFHQKSHQSAIDFGRAVGKRDIPNNIYWYQKGLFNYLCKKD